jgi:hypothetical protein
VLAVGVLGVVVLAEMALDVVLVRDDDAARDVLAGVRGVVLWDGRRDMARNEQG